MENFLKAEVIVPIAINTLLAITTIAYLLETRSMRKGMLSQIELSRRQHFVTAAPFIYPSSINIDKKDNSIKITISNPSEKLARDIKYIIFDFKKKTFRAIDKSQVVVKPSEESTAILPDEPFTKVEVENKVKKFYGIKNLEKDLMSEGEGAISYIILLYTDIEGTVYSVKANIVENESGDGYVRQRSRFKKVYDPKD